MTLPMHSNYFSLRKTLLLLSTLVLGSAAHADGTIVFSSASSIPTMSEWGLVIMALVLAGLAIRTLRKSKHSRATPLAVLVVAMGFAAFANSNGMLAQAMNTGVRISHPGPLQVFNQPRIYTNASGQNLIVASMSGPNTSEQDNPCTVNMVLLVGESCSCGIYTPYSPPSPL
jgi:hypothetical protein